MDAAKLKEQRDLIDKLQVQTGKGAYSKPISASYDAATNATLLDLARDGLRFRVIKLHAEEGIEGSPLRDQRYVDEIDRQLAIL